MRIRQLAHSVYQVQYHLVWGTKYRRKILKYYVRKELIVSIYKTLKMHKDWYMEKINTDEDHVHMMIEVPPSYAIADVVRELKSYSSAHLRKRFKFIDEIYRRSGIWSRGYFVSTVGLNEERIKKYIEFQNKQDIGVDLFDEFS